MKLNKRLIGFIAFFVSILAGQALANAQDATGSISDTRAVYAPVGKSTSIPIGWKLFCAEQPEECVPSGTGAQSVKLDAYAWRQLVAINSLANTSIEGVADVEHYGLKKLGLPNWWTYPDDGKGNCNDYALLKRKLLVEAGWPKSALLLTVVLDHHQQGHLILTVRTGAGDLILDNLNPEILRWNETGYTFLKRQSPTNPSVWLAIDQQRSPAIASMSVNR